MRRVGKNTAMLYEIVHLGDPSLRQNTRRIPPDDIRTSFIQELVASMRQTMNDASGVGLAGPQIGEALQIAVMEDSGSHLESMSVARRKELNRTSLPFTVLINPIIEPLTSSIAEYFEGCLSCPDLFGLVKRWQSVKLISLDGDGRRTEAVYDGWPARIVQHEVDHLNGVLFLDRTESRTLTNAKNLGRFWKARPAAELRKTLGVPSDD